MIRIIAGAVLLAGLAGCAPDLSALAADPAAVCVKVTTPWGTSEVSRNFGCQPKP